MTSFDKKAVTCQLLLKRIKIHEDKHIVFIEDKSMSLPKEFILLISIRMYYYLQKQSQHKILENEKINYQTLLR